MTELPEPLRAWAPELEGLSDASLAALAPWLPRLASLIGPFVELRPATLGEPEGFDGIANRGRYERLLLGEWLLADEAPLEFMRRAAAGQHLFHNLARKQPARSRCCVVLVDAGPGQLGAPRLVALALLIVLARRAREAGARLCWGIVQELGLLRDGFDGVGALALVGARTLVPSDADQLELWLEHLREIDLQADERWVIGDPRLEAAARSFEISSTAWISEPLPSPAQGFARSLTIAVHDRARGRPRRELSLPLPDAQLGAAILRDPTRRPVANSKQGPRSNRWTFAAPKRIWTDPAGRRVFAWTPDGMVIGYHVPSSANQAPGRPRICMPRDGGVLLGVTARGKKLVSLVATRTELLMYNVRRDGRPATFEIYGPFAQFIDDARQNPGDNRLLGGVHTPFVLHTNGGWVMRLEIVDDALIVGLEMSEIRAVTLDGIRLAVQGLDRPRVYGFQLDGDLCPILGSEALAGLEIVGFGWSATTHDPLLLRRPAGGLEIHLAGWQSNEVYFLDGIAADETVIGPIVRLEPGQQPTASLLLIDGSRRRIVERTNQGETVLRTFDADVSAATLCTRFNGLVAAWTEDNELWAYDLLWSRTLLFQRLADEVNS